MDCKRCGLCCRTPCVPLRSEIKPIADFLSISASQLESCLDTPDLPGLAQFLGHDVSYRWRKGDSGYCIFYDEANRACTIYQVRPQAAREFNCKKEVKDGKQGLSGNSLGPEDSTATMV